MNWKHAFWAIACFVMVFWVGFVITRTLPEEVNRVTDTFAVLQLVQLWFAFISGICFGAFTRGFWK